MKKGLLAKKSVQSLMRLVESESHHKGLKRALGPVQLTALGIGAVIGAGIFVLTGQAAANYAGPAVVFSFFFAALIAFFSGFCYSEMASIVPVSGGGYTYSYVALGEFPAWIVGWTLIMEYIVVYTAVAVGWSGYFISFIEDFGIKLSPLISKAPLQYDTVNGWTATGAYIDLPAMCIVALLGTLVALGIRVASSVNSLLVLIKLTIIFLFIIFGISFLSPSNWIPFIPDNTGVFGQFGWSGILRAAGVLFFAYNGFDVVATLAQESKRPQKDLPLGMLGSLGISTTLYFTVALILTGIVSYTLLNVPDPIAVAINAFGSHWAWLRFLIKPGILAGLSSVILAQLLGTTRILYTISHDRLLPSHFGKLHPKFRTPLFATLVITLISMVLGALFPVGVLGLLVSMGALFVFCSVNFGVLIFRYTHPGVKRPFKCPLFPWIPIAGVLLCLGQMVLLPLTTWIQFLVWLVIGCVVYFRYSKKHSALQRS